MQETNPLHTLEQDCRDKAVAAIHRSNVYWNSQLYFHAGEALKEARRLEDMADEITQHPQY
jgi:hypothetical protein